MSEQTKDKYQKFKTWLLTFGRINYDTDGRMCRRFERSSLSMQLKIICSEYYDIMRTDIPKISVINELLSIRKNEITERFDRYNKAINYGEEENGNYYDSDKDYYNLSFPELSDILADEIKILNDEIQLLNSYKDNIIKEERRRYNKNNYI